MDLILRAWLTPEQLQESLDDSLLKLEDRFNLFHDAALLAQGCALFGVGMTDTVLLFIDFKSERDEIHNRELNKHFLKCFDRFRKVFDQ